MNYESVNKEVLNLLKEKLEQNSFRFEAKLMAYESPKLEIINNNPLEYTSELRSRIFKNGNLEDVIEFFVFYKGKQRVANNEFSDWIDNTLSDILGTNRV